MRYIIYGAGGIGGGIGAQLFRQGHEVVLIARGPHLERIQGQGLTVCTPEEESTLAIPAVGHPREIDFGDDDLVVLTMKSQDTVAALEALRLAAGDLPVISAQNGVANERLAARRFTRVYALAVYMPATFLEPGVVLLYGTPLRGCLDCGCFPRGIDPLIEQVCSDLRAAQFDSSAHADIMRYKHGKLLLNLGNAAQALCGIEADLRGLTKILRREAMACYDAAGIDFVTAKELVRLNSERYEVGKIRGAARKGGSSWQGLVRGLRTIETDFLNGEITLLGTLYGVPTPYNRTVQELATRAAAEGRVPGSTTLDDIVSLAEGRARRDADRDN